MSNHTDPPSPSVSAGSQSASSLEEAKEHLNTAIQELVAHYSSAAAQGKLAVWPKDKAANVDQRRDALILAAQAGVPREIERRETNDLGALCATEADAVSCSVPTGQLSHADGPYEAAARAWIPGVLSVTFHTEHDMHGGPDYRVCVVETTATVSDVLAAEDRMHTELIDKQVIGTCAVSYRFVEPPTPPETGNQSSSGTSGSLRSEAQESSPSNSSTSLHTEQQITQLKAGGWQPIETAPKDGTPRILIYWPNYSYDYVSVPNGDKYPLIDIGWWGGCRGACCWVNTEELDCYGLAQPEHAPTHWMPLPSAPSADPPFPQTRHDRETP